MRRWSSIIPSNDSAVEGMDERPDSELDEIEEQLRSMWRARGYGSHTKREPTTPASSLNSVPVRTSQPAVCETPGSRFQPPLTTSERAARLLLSIDAELASPPRQVQPRKLMPPSVLVVDILLEDEEDHMLLRADQCKKYLGQDGSEDRRHGAVRDIPTEPNYSVLASPTSSPIAPSLSPPNPRMDSPPTPMPSHRSYGADSESSYTTTTSPLRVVSSTMLGMRNNHAIINPTPLTTWDISSGIVIEEDPLSSPPPRVMKTVYDDVVVSPSTARSCSTSQGATQCSSLRSGRSSEAAGCDVFAPTPLLPRAVPPPSRSHPTPIPTSSHRSPHHFTPTPIPAASFPAPSMYR